MRFSSIILILLASYLGVIKPADAGQYNHEIAYFRAAYRAMDDANSHKNAPGAAAYCAPDFAVVSATGKQLIGSKQEAVQQLAGVFKYMSHVTEATTIDKCVFGNDGAEVTNTSDTDFTFTVKGKSSSIHDRTTRRDLWVKTAGGWQEKHSTTLVSHDYPNEKKTESAPKSAGSA